ncbi:DNA adenine methylase [Neisseria lactamica]|uniref:site-specific DNA-methyltransferase (adenine-specific) n=2 Tax=Neisseria lactamica TaxID=486 RepID=E4ZAF1_NEIL0|nr:DNA adenine methylase [Neisseria lactamica]ARB03750.1 modification methylase [Neisseria lactamica]CBN86412.1 modification methylase [Neisseria lactamica 020-06]CBX23132.1 DNA cytosine methyltransferase M.NlaIII [Neisseria lactamica Y92-1009]
MNYIGSKLKLSNWLETEISNVAGHSLSDKVFCDLFAGTGIVGRKFKTNVKQVIANDMEYYSYVLNRNYIGNCQSILKAGELLQRLEQLPPKEGLVYRHYCLGSGSERQYFSDENGKKIDAVRIQIEEWKNTHYIDEDTYYFLLATLLESADKVANTASVYGAFLKNLKKSALKPLSLEPALFEIGSDGHQVYQADANKLIKNISGDILYLDPPYNARQYGANYHLLNSIALYDDFTPKGKTGLREYSRSKYCSKSDVVPVFEALIRDADFQYIFLSYNNEGLMSIGQVREIFERFGKYDLVQTEYRRFKADKTENRNHKANSTFEYLHILEKTF